jgi:hypothetical protein
MSKTANRWRSGYFRNINDTFVGYLTPTGSVQDVEVCFKLKTMARILEDSKDIQMEVANEFLIGSVRQTDQGYKTADVIMQNKVVRLKLNEMDYQNCLTLKR